MPNEEAVPEVADPADLYSLPLDRFTAARDFLARRMRAEGRVDEAERVGKLPKPSVAAWALNRVAVASPDLVERLLDSHRLVRAAVSLESMRSASEERRQAVAALVEAAVAALGAGGRRASGQTRDRIATTLLAVATDPEGEAQLEAGRLVRELKPAGAGWGDSALTPVSAERSPGVAAAAERARARAERLEKEVAAAERQLAIAERALTVARRRVKAVRAEYREASDEVTRAEEAAHTTQPKE